MAEAITLGYVPTIEKAKELSTAITDTAEAAESAGEKWLKSIEGISPALDAIIAKARAAGDAVAGASGGGATGGGASGGKAGGKAGGAAGAAGTGPFPTLGGGTGTVLGGIVSQPTGSGLQPFTNVPAWNLGPGSTAPTGGGMGSAVNQYRGGSYTGMSGTSFQHGGIVPGFGPVPIIAHGGEQILPAGGRSGGGGMVRIEPGAIQISGTVIDQSRDWAVLVETLGQALAARLR